MSDYTLQKFDQAISVGALNVGCLSSYIQWTSKIPLLSAEEENDLAWQLKNKNDIEAARKMVLSHLRLVVKIARAYAGYGLQQADLIQEGNIGLMKAVRRFNPEMGVRLVSFSIHWIRAEIHEYVIRNWRIVKIATTKAQRKLFFNLRKMAKKRGWFSNDEVDTVAETLNVSRKDVRQMEARLNNYDQSFDGYDDDSSVGGLYSAPAHYLEDYAHNPERNLESKDWSNQQTERLYSMIAALDARSQDIINSRWLSEKKQTLRQLADKYKISAERVRQLEKIALNKLQELIADQSDVG